MSEKEKLLQQQGRHYRFHWNGVLLLICQVGMPLLLGGLMSYFIWKENDILDSALAVYTFFLPLAAVGGILNLFIGRVIAVFEEKGFYGLREIEQSLGKGFQNKEELIFIPYDRIQKIQYLPTRSNRPICKSEYSAVEVTFTCSDVKGQQYIDICVLRCGAVTRGARDFAKMIARMGKKKSGRTIPVKHETVSAGIFVEIMALVYILYFFIVIWG